MIQFAQITDVGRVRDHNEDSLISLPEQEVWLVADGMGGYEAGEVASAIVVEEIPKLLSQQFELNEALEETHRLIHKAAEAGRGELGMGSTAVLLRIDGSTYEIAWVGDSRAYLWDGSSLMQLTRDHSFVQRLLDSGAITEEEALDHPQRNVISQALGADMKEIRVDTVRGKLARNDKILLCSDGLTSELSDSDIAAVLARNESSEVMSKSLVHAANESGGGDNITLILVEAPEDAPKRVKRGATRPMNAITGIRGRADKKRNMAPLYAIAGFLLAAIPVLIWVLMGQTENASPPKGGSAVLGPSPIKMGAISKQAESKELRDVLGGRDDKSSSSQSAIPVQGTGSAITISELQEQTVLAPEAVPTSPSAAKNNDTLLDSIRKPAERVPQSPAIITGTEESQHD